MDPKSLKVIKLPAGDIALVVPLDKATARSLIGEKLTVEIGTELPKPRCLVRYDRFTFKEDFIVRPMRKG